MALFRERSVLEDHFLVDAPYMRTDAAARFVNLGERSVQGTRHADILKLWLAFQHFGTSGFACLIAESYERTEQFVARLRERPDFELATEPETNVICFRHTRPGFTEGELDGWNFGLQRYLYDEHQVFVSVPQFRGSRWLRAVLLNRFAGDMGIERLLAGVDAYVAEDEFLRRLHRS